MSGLPWLAEIIANTRLVASAIDLAWNAAMSPERRNPLVERWLEVALSHMR